MEALGLAYGVACSEDAAYERPSEILRTGSRVFPTYPISVLPHAPQFTFWTDGCRIWNVPEAPISQREITVSAIPILVMPGTFDAKTGAQWGRYAAQTLSNSTGARFSGIGHAGISSSACARAVFASFLATPTAPDVACVADVKPLWPSIHSALSQVVTF